jgi:2-oxo-3-hexenedioate decarboxylase/2-keto-4-pentenoate hydratase
MQEMLGVNEPDYGHLFEDMFFSSDGVIQADRFLQPRVEVEIAFRLKSALIGPGITVDDVLAATEAVAPSIEIIDSRIADWKITLADTIADNASSAGVVVGPWSSLASTPHLEEVSVDMLKNGQIAASGTGADVMGHPAAAVAWLANKLSALKISLDAGHVVLPGSCTKVINVTGGDHIRAEFKDLGDVSIEFA